MALRRPRGRKSNIRRDPRRDQTFINERIRANQVRVIDENNDQLGVLETRDAINLARDRGLDLILVAPQATPPVCRIMDYGKYKYEKSKREKQAQKKSAAHEMKMVRLHPRTGEHDREILIRNCEKFLREGHKVRVVCQFRGRENAYPELGRGQMDAVSEALAAISTVEGPITKQGRDMTMNLAPKPGLKPLPKEPKDGIATTSADEVPDVEDEDLEDVELEDVEDDDLDDEEFEDDELEDDATSADADNTTVNNTPEDGTSLKPIE